MAEEELLRMTADVVAAYVSNNTLADGAAGRGHQCRLSLVEGAGRTVAEPPPEPPKPAVPIRKSITPDYLVCLEDGKKLKMLKRHLRSTYNMTPDEYRARWGLPPDYPMVAPKLRRAALGLRQKDRPRPRLPAGNRPAQEIASTPPIRQPPTFVHRGAA